MISDEEEIPIVDGKDLKYVTKFEQLYLIGKILGKTMPLKTIISCVAEWKVPRKVTIMDSGHGYSLMNSLVLLIVTEPLKDNLGL